MAVITPPGADLAITKTPATFVPGRSLTYTLVVSNLGPSTSTNALVQDTLPADVTAPPGRSHTQAVAPVRCRAQATSTPR